MRLKLSYLQPQNVLKRSLFFIQPLLLPEQKSIEQTHFFLQTCVDKCDDFKQCVLCTEFGRKAKNNSNCDDCPSIKVLDSVDALKKRKYYNSKLYHKAN